MHFFEIFRQKKCLFGSKLVFLGQELNLQICDYPQKRRICRKICMAIFAPDERLPSSATLLHDAAYKQQSTLIPLGSTAVRASPFSEDGVIRCWSKVGPTGHNSLPPGRDICGRQARLGHNHNRDQSRKKLHQRKKICHPLLLQCPSSQVDEQCS